MLVALPIYQHLRDVYRTDDLEKDEEELKGTVHFDGGYEVNIVTFVYPLGTVSVSSLGSF